jgi:hypothetical protein
LDAPRADQPRDTKLKAVAAELDELATKLRAGELSDSPMLKRITADSEKKDMCHFTSRWFEQEADRLDMIWQYLSARAERWGPGIHASFDEIAVELRRIPGPLRWLFGVPDTAEKVRHAVDTKMKTRKPFKCGALFSQLSNDDLHKAQQIGTRLIEAVSKFVVKDMREGNTGDQEEALAVAEAMIIALNNARVSR